MSQHLSALATPLQQPVRNRRQWGSPLQTDPGARKILYPGDKLFYAGETCRHAYLIRTGSIKSYIDYEDGEEQILGLHGPGDILGFEAALELPATCTATAVDTTSVQVLINPAQALGPDSSSSVAQVMFEALYREMCRFTQRLHSERHPSDRRMAEFLLDFSQRQMQQGLSSQNLRLPVSRRVLARYLGLAPETVSRTLSSFQARNILQVNNRRVSIVDPEALRAAANGE